MKTIEVFGKSFIVAPILTGQMEDLYDQDLKPRLLNHALVAGSLSNGGTPYTPEDVAQLEWRVYQAVLKAVLEVNGIEVPQQPGGVEAAAQALAAA